MAESPQIQRHIELCRAIVKRIERAEELLAHYPKFDGTEIEIDIGLDGVRTWIDWRNFAGVLRIVCWTSADRADQPRRTLESAPISARIWALPALPKLVVKVRERYEELLPAGEKLLSVCDKGFEEL